MRFKVFYKSEVGDPYYFDPTKFNCQVVNIKDMDELQELYRYFDENELIIDFNRRTIVIYDEWRKDYDKSRTRTDP